MYLSRLAVGRGASGAGLGAVLIYQSLALAATAGRAYVRLHFPSQNDRLRRTTSTTASTRSATVHLTGPRGEAWRVTVMERASTGPETLPDAQR